MPSRDVPSTVTVSYAAQFGHAAGRAGALRYALQLIGDEATATGPVRTLEDATEPHERGQFLVAAIFDAFATIYERRIADLCRLADYRPKGWRRAADRARSPAGARGGQDRRPSAAHMRARARYLPPVDNSFGKYLRDRHPRRGPRPRRSDALPRCLRPCVSQAGHAGSRLILCPVRLMWAKPDLSDLTHLATKTAPFTKSITRERSPQRTKS